MSFQFDDYLNLSSWRLVNKRVVVFIGCSGAGKSSYIEYLLSQHPDFFDRDVYWIVEGRPLIWNEMVPTKPSLVVVDELLVFRDLRQVAKLMYAGHCLLIASHLPRFWHWPLRLFGSMVQFQIDGVRLKVVNALVRRQVQFSERAVDDFIRQYGANYTDLDMILETCPIPDLDTALHHFSKFYSVERVRNN